jgi:hypothetical protein
VTAVCTNWTQLRTSIDGITSTVWGVPVDVLKCPDDAERDCAFYPTYYDVTVRRLLYTPPGGWLMPEQTAYVG